MGYNVNNLVLHDGSTIGVIGGGPAGSFFSYFALDFAQQQGIKINIDIIEAKDFNCTGPRGCNHCGGIVSESLIQMLSTEGIELPSTVIRRGIKSYTLHFEQGGTVIETPFREQRIASMFRGIGPLGDDNKDQESFDNYLLELCRKKGAQFIQDTVIEMNRVTDGIVVKTRNELIKKYDLVVGAAGLNARTLALFNPLISDFKPPETTKTYVAELKLDRQIIDQYFGNSMHVFLLNIPNIKFGALIPKGQYVTSVLLGSNIDLEIVNKFLLAETVKNCFPPDIDINEIMPCQCYPRINVVNAKTAYADRVVLIGDSSSSKLYKNGIGAAYITGKAAAATAVFNGFSKADFQQHFQPVCTTLDKDNRIGKFIFSVTSIIQKASFLKRGILNMVIKEQQKSSLKREMSYVLWDTFTGSAPYSNILKRVLHPGLIFNLVWNIMVGNIKKQGPVEN
ncbi:hypothetical protein SLH46_06385 [Draconibacterium sp. IB214405]|uniref:NAD(P)/FAD-dependent oxidoreductase n=1 Tax=Draconibacterium sp. IB214405 TaxID=3097352 RepID=UPI002A0CA67B|nr:hypothetical protein [Draconibacterium sp. IB214405]MDX8338800.1 hypothetical protein [Draconibacterium sp. IB214405]